MSRSCAHLFITGTSSFLNYSGFGNKTQKYQKERTQINHINIASNSQENIHVQSKIDGFFDRFKIDTLLHRCGVRKRHGHGVRSLTQVIFTLPFVGKNLFRGIGSIN